MFLTLFELEIDTQKEQDEQIRETGQLTLDQNKRKHRIELRTIIGEVEGHDHGVYDRVAG